MKIGYALGGGGGKGGFSAGICYSLHKNGITPDVVSGISVGALNGIMVATGQYDQMKEVWHTVIDDDVRKESGPFRYGLGLARHLIGIGDPVLGYWSSEPLQKLVRRLIIGKETVCEYYCGAVKVSTNDFVYFHIPKGIHFTDENVDQYVKMIVASTAIPGIFEPINISGKKYVDGGVHHQMPLEPMSTYRNDVDYIIGVSHKHRGFPGTEIRSDIDMAQWAISVLLDEASDEEFERFEMINALVKAGVTEWKGKTRKYYPSKIFRPMKSLSPSTRFHHRFSKSDFVHGEQMARRFTMEKVEAESN